MCRKIQPKRKTPVTAMTAFLPRAELQNDPNQVRDVGGGELSSSVMLTRSHHIRRDVAVNVMSDTGGRLRAAPHPSVRRRTGALACPSSHERKRTGEAPVLHWNRLVHITRAARSGATERRTIVR